MQTQSEKQSKDKQVTAKENLGQILDFCLQATRVYKL